MLSIRHNPKFYVETKKPHIDIRADREAALQLRRYALSTGSPLSVVTNFRHFLIYDCRAEITANDDARTGMIQEIGFEDYLIKWGEIWDIFSKQRLEQGSFDRFASQKRLAGTLRVDEGLLRQIEGWRVRLAEDIVEHNPQIDLGLLNFAVEKTIDRIVFLRMCEDREIETETPLSRIITRDGIYGRLRRIFRWADQRFNSGLFHFLKEPSRLEPPDAITPHLIISDDALKDIISSLYFPRSPYIFSAIPIEILGQAYEKFLGKVISITPTGEAEIREKPEVRHAKGVYYTPQYIVDYIVQHTVGKVIDGKTPERVRSLRLLDPACGSGSFLVQAYQYLLDWHLKYYSEHEPQNRIGDQLYRSSITDEWRLTTQEKRRILLNNIYGVDVDSQAVEVTKLSLLLKFLANETEQTFNEQRQLAFFPERVLPDLSNNIKCGNSVVQPDFYDTVDPNEVTLQDRLQINAFDWHQGFPRIFERKNPGFDVIIGNPPYLGNHKLREFHNEQMDYFVDQYTCAKGRFDYYMLFLEQGLELLSRGGRLGYICPHKFTNSSAGRGIRSILTQEHVVELFLSFGVNYVFNDASTYTCIMILKKSKMNSVRYYTIPKTPCIELPLQLSSLADRNYERTSSSNLTSEPWQLISKAACALLEKMQAKCGLVLRDVCSDIQKEFIRGLKKSTL